MHKILVLAILCCLLPGCSRKKVVEATYDNGKPRVVKYYHKKGGELVLEREIVYYKNEQKKLEGAYKDRQREGVWKAWYENGNLWSEGEYKDGKREGRGLSYHENGKKYIEGNYRNDMRVGVWRFYDTTEKLTSEVNFDIVPRTMERDSLK